MQVSQLGQALREVTPAPATAINDGTPRVESERYFPLSRRLIVLQTSIIKVYLSFGIEQVHA